MTDHPSDASGYRLAVSARPGPDTRLHVALDGSGSPDGPGLRFLGGDFRQECWDAPGEEIQAVVLGEPDDPAGDAAETAERIYRRLIGRLEESSFGYPLRLWNYFPAINAGDGDRERYRRFCVGRG
ncbi:MAG: hypothetical protein ACNS61_10180, partial [Candidatus Wenzhouxiangella sp. M2_3B_020]